MPATPLYNEKELVLKTALGDEMAFRQLFDAYWANIYAVAFSFTKSSVLSEDIVQEVFLKIWLKREHLHDVVKFEAYLFTLARNYIYNELRKKYLLTSDIEKAEQTYLESSHLPEELLYLKETTQLIEKAVAQLPNQQRQVFELSRYKGLNHNEIADCMGISKLTVKSHLTKALYFVRRALLASKKELLLLLYVLSYFKS